MNNDYFEFSSDISFNDFETKTYLNFISEFVNSPRENLVTLLLCFGIGLNVNGDENKINFTDMIDREEHSDSFNVPRTIINKPDIKNKLRMYYIIALMKKRHEYLSNSIMQNIWIKDIESEDFKEAEAEFREVVALGARKFVEIYFDYCEREISLLPKFIYQLENNIDLKKIEIDLPSKEVENISIKEQIDILEKQKREIDAKIFRLKISKED